MNFERRCQQTEPKRQNKSANASFEGWHRKPYLLGVIALLLIYTVPFFVTGCAMTPEERSRDQAIKNFVTSLFDIDMGLAKKYRFAEPRKLYPEYPGDVARFYVDQKYFAENLQLRSLISDDALAAINTPGNQKFSLPLWMTLEVKGKKLGRVVRIKHVDQIFIEGLDHATRPEDGAVVKVVTIVGLDTGKEHEVEFKFGIHLVKSETESRPYLVDKARFTLDPWEIKIGKGIFAEWYTPPEFTR